MAKKTNDPHLQREAEKYEKPVASREHILALLAERGKPATHEQLVILLALDDDDRIEGLRRRLRAMQRDGQLMCNRRRGYALVEKMHLIAGTVRAHKDGFGFLLCDKGGKDLYLNNQQMRSLFDGDRILVNEERSDWKGRRGVKVIEVIERNTTKVVGRYEVEDGVAFVEPNNKRLTQSILIPEHNRHGAKAGQIVSVTIVKQPNKHYQALGEVTEILGEAMAPGMEVDMAVRSHHIPYQWSDAIKEQVAQLAPEVVDSTKKGRKDLRKLPLITIDSEDAKDFDDAVYCQPRLRGGWRLYVAIADVSHYVTPDSDLDIEAQQRGNSVYFPGRVIPMLPEVLSNGLCSLKPKVDRLCMVCEMGISASGKITRYKFYSAVMCSHARMTYTNVEKILRGDKKIRKQYHDIVPDIENLHSLYNVLWKAREKRGALDFDTVETRIIFSKNKKIERIVPSQRGDAHRLIEECMLAANVSAAAFVNKTDLTALFRVHPIPGDEKIKNLRLFLSSIGLQLPKKITSKSYAKLLDQVRQRDDFFLIQTVMLRSLEPARYCPDIEGHFGLGYDAYTHFTSPIRRYPDLLLHRVIRAAIEKHDQPTLDHDAMRQLGEHCSQTERRADEATRDVTDWLKCEFMQEKLGQQFVGKISTVTAFGVFVTLDDIYAEGLVHITGLQEDYYDFDNVKHHLRGQRTGKIYQLGDKLTIQVARVDLDKREIDFELIG